MAAQLQDLRRVWKQLLRANQWEALFESLASYLDEDADASNTVLLLQADYNRTQQSILKGILSEEQVRLAYNSLTHRMNDTIDAIEAEDLVPDWVSRLAAAESTQAGSKNVVSGSTITAGGNVHIGDVVHYLGADATKPNIPSMSPGEKEGIERAIALKTRVINKLRETLALEDDPIRSIRYEEQLRQAEADLAELNAKLG